VDEADGGDQATAQGDDAEKGRRADAGDVAGQVKTKSVRVCADLRVAGTAGPISKQKRVEIRRFRRLCGTFRINRAWTPGGNCRQKRADRLSELVEGVR
jgi:hypothetical protein